MINKYIVIFLLRKNLQLKNLSYTRQVSKFLIITELGVNQYNLKKKKILLHWDKKQINSIKFSIPIQFYSRSSRYLGLMATKANHLSFNHI